MLLQSLWLEKSDGDARAEVRQAEKSHFCLNSRGKH